MIYYVKMIQYVSYYMKKRNTFYLVTMCEAQKKRNKNKVSKTDKTKENLKQK